VVFLLSEVSYFKTLKTKIIENQLLDIL